jgi:hypothetical protein
MGVATWVSASSFGQKRRLPSHQCYAATDATHRPRQPQPDVPKTIRCSGSRFGSSASICVVGLASRSPGMSGIAGVGSDIHEYAVSGQCPFAAVAKSDLESARSCESSIPANQFSSQNTRRAQLHTRASDDSITRSARNLLKIFVAVFADAVNEMNRKFPHAELRFIKSGGDNLAATSAPSWRT